MLLSAKSIAWVETGASGIYLKGVFEKLGVAEQIKGKLKSVHAAGEAVANGEAEIGFTQVSEVLPFAGAEVGGMLPAGHPVDHQLLAWRPCQGFQARRGAGQVPDHAGGRRGDQGQRARAALTRLLKTWAFPPAPRARPGRLIASRRLGYRTGTGIARFTTGKGVSA